MRPAVWERESNLRTVSAARRFSPKLRRPLDCWQAIDSMRGPGLLLHCSTDDTRGGNICKEGTA